MPIVIVTKILGKICVLFGRRDSSDDLLVTTTVMGDFPSWEMAMWYADRVAKPLGAELRTVKED